MIKKVLAGITSIMLLFGGIMSLSISSHPEIDTLSEISALAVTIITVTLGLIIFMIIVVLLGGYALGLFDD